MGTKTGGPECLYQLGAMLKELGHESILIPFIETRGLKPAQDFQIYNLECLKGKKIRSNDILIVPEVINRIPKWLEKKIKTQIVMWWLSVDNSPHPFFRNYELKNFTYNTEWNLVDDIPIFNKTLKRLFKLILGQSQNTILNSLRSRFKPLWIKFNTREINLENCHHIAQSSYAKSVVESFFNVKVKIVSDYTRFDHDFMLGKSIKKLGLEENKLIAFNPYKGKRFLDLLIPIMPENYRFIPIINMNSTQVREALNKSDLYLDLGHFPGKDRIPREAILCGTPVLLALRGAVRNSYDFKLQSKYKIDMYACGPTDVKERILLIFRDSDQVNQIEFLSEQNKSYEIFKAEVKKFIEDLQ